MLSINPINNISFKAYHNTIKDGTGKIVNRGHTCFFRWDLAFDNLIDYIDTKYADCEKVNIIAHACSDGEEVFSLISKMYDMLGKDKIKKFLPIYAGDIQREHIKLANKAEYKIESFEKGAIDFYLGSDFYKYFEKTSVNNVKASSLLRNSVHFSVANIVNDAEKMDFNNTVLLARNFWHYLSSYNVDKLTDILSQKMNKTSTLVLGSYDREYGIDGILYKKGFKESNRIGNVFEKI